MNKDVDKEVGVSCAGFVAEQNGKIIASAKTFDGLMRKKVIKKLLESETLTLRHVIPKGVTRKTIEINRENKNVPQTPRRFVEALMESGLPITVVRVKIDPKMAKAVRKYVKNIEEAHKRAKHSQLRIGTARPLTVS